MRLQDQSMADLAARNEPIPCARPSVCGCFCFRTGDNNRAEAFLDSFRNRVSPATTREDHVILTSS